MTERSSPVAYLDSMTFIFSIEGTPEVSDPVKALFQLLRDYPGAAATSELTLAEVLAGSERARSAPTRRAYLDLIVWSKFIDLVPISRGVLYESADLRFMHEESHGKKLKLPDAIHLVTAIRKRCLYFISADKGIRPPFEMIRIYPSADAVREIRKALV